MILSDAQPTIPAAALWRWGARLLRAAGSRSLASHHARRKMVEEQLRSRGIHDRRVLAAMLEVPRELFVPDELRAIAYEDCALPIGGGQTISQPYVVALMLQELALDGTESVLDVGTGSGYAAAVVSCLAAEIHSVERLPRLAEAAERRLRRHGFSVHVHCGDGSLGLPAFGPFDGIAVAASAPAVSRALTTQLKLGGRLIAPIKEHGRETLVAVHRLARDEFRRENVGEVRFVPLIGAYGYPQPKTPLQV